MNTTENAQDAAKKMNDKRISSVLIVDKNKSSEEPVGIVTERTLSTAYALQGHASRDCRTK
jgi:signal-transduction protein with cAMP-binding, CBS, and nucleotidyltransferase domain